MRNLLGKALKAAISVPGNYHEADALKNTILQEKGNVTGYTLVHTEIACLKCKKSGYVQSHNGKVNKCKSCNGSGISRQTNRIYANYEVGNSVFYQLFKVIDGPKINYISFDKVYDKPITDKIVPSKFGKTSYIILNWLYNENSNCKAFFKMLPLLFHIHFDPKRLSHANRSKAKKAL